MKTLNLVIRCVLIISVFLPASIVQADNGVDDLRGRWDFQWAFSNSGGNPGDPLPPLIIYINDMRPSTTIPNTFFAAGCMRSPETKAFMPLSMKATYDSANNSYTVILYSTIVPLGQVGEPYLIRFNGIVEVGGESVKDDQANGMLITQFAGGEWSGVHHDRRQTKCPSVRDAGLGFQGDLYAQRDLSQYTPQAWTIYEGYTVIVSSGMLVEAPDGSQAVVQEYTDIFSPDVDFVGRFRYLNQMEGPPLMGGTYRFTLLDIFGDPIAGTESTDVWYACNQTAPSNLNAQYAFEDHAFISWDAVPNVLGEFEPGSNPQIGFYQIGISPFQWQGQSNYGAAGIASTNHVIPWNAFEPGAVGSPDGFDFGVAPSQFQDGVYQINLSAFSQANPQNHGSGLECMTFDSTQDVLMTKQGSELSFQHIGTISGFVYDAEGNPLGGIGVDTEQGGYGACTDGNGYYILVNIPEGQVNIVAGRGFCDPHPFAEQTVPNVQVGATDVNFHLNLAYQPTLHVVPAYPEIHGHGWNPEATVTIYVDEDDDIGNGFLYTESKLVTDEPTWCIEPCFDMSQVPELPNGILPGYVVTMTDGVATRIVHTTNLVWTEANPGSDSVIGTADPGAWVEVTVHGPVTGQRMVQANGNGDWVANFSIAGPQDFEKDILNLEPGYHGRSIQFESGIPDDGTLAYWSIEEPVVPQYTIIAQPDHEWVSSFGWTTGDEITMYLDNNTDPSDGYGMMMTQAATPADWDPNIGMVWFDGWAPFDLAPGMFVIFTNGINTETLQVESLTVDQFDVGAETVSGTAPAGREVGVGVNQPGGNLWMIVTSDGDGNWSADFSTQGADLVDPSDIHAMIWDSDGDATQANYNFP